MRGVLVAVAVLLLAGCTGHHQNAAAPSATVDTVKHDLATLDLADPKSVHALDRDERVAGAADAARQVLATSPADAAAWGAVYLYLAAGTDPAPLAPFLADAHPDTRAMAAAGAVADGDADGFPVLVDLLADNALMRASEPPLPISRFAGETLVRVTGDASRGPSADASAADLAAAQTRWRAWWQQQKSKLRFDAAQQLWVSA